MPRFSRAASSPNLSPQLRLTDESRAVSEQKERDFTYDHVLGPAGLYAPGAPLPSSGVEANGQVRVP
jgi:hypothetical protein